MAKAKLRIDRLELSLDPGDEVNDELGDPSQQGLQEQFEPGFQQARNEIVHNAHSFPDTC